MLTIEIAPNQDASLSKTVFEQDTLQLGQERSLDQNTTLINMSAGGDNMSASDFITLALEYGKDVDSYIIGGILYDLLKTSAHRILVKGREIKSRQDMSDAIENAKG